MSPLFWSTNVETPYKLNKLPPSTIVHYGRRLSQQRKQQNTNWKNEVFFFRILNLCEMRWIFPYSVGVNCISSFCLFQIWFKSSWCLQPDFNSYISLIWKHLASKRAFWRTTTKKLWDIFLFKMLWSFSDCGIWYIYVKTQPSLFSLKLILDWLLMSWWFLLQLIHLFGFILLVSARFLSPDYCSTSFCGIEKSSKIVQRDSYIYNIGSSSSESTLQINIVILFSANLLSFL